MSDYKLSILSKRLQSGKCQIKFEVSQIDNKLMYGYLLSEAGATLKEVVNKIEQQVKVTMSGDRLSHSHLYNLHCRQQENEIIIFKH